MCRQIGTGVCCLLLCMAMVVNTRAQGPDPAGKERRGQAQRPPAGERGPKAQGQRYTLEQATSDRAQLHTIAFSGLAFLTGDFGASTFIPPGKVCDFFGFQYMRDIDAAGKGHNPVFLDRIAGNVFALLTDGQKDAFAALAEKQAPQLEELARMRLPLIKAFHEQSGNISARVPGELSREAVGRYVGDIFAMDAQLSLERAEVMAQVAASLTSTQRTKLAKMRFGDFNTWPAVDQREAMKERGRGKPHIYNVAFMTYLSEFFSWTAGSVEADTYFCPERHGTYFGGFFMKDMPAMGKRDYDISTAVTGDSGRDFLETILNPDQRALITSLVDRQRNALAEAVKVRHDISTELRKFLAGVSPDRARVLALGHRYGELDGEMSYNEAMAFAAVNRTLTDAQRQAMKTLRNLDGYASAPYYIYSQPAREPILSALDTSRFFAVNAASK